MSSPHSDTNIRGGLVMTEADNTGPLVDVLVRVNLDPDRGNAVGIIGMVSRALAGAGRMDLAEQYGREALLGDFDHLLTVSAKYVRLETERDEDRDTD
jgi:hypothetical protein